jgi:SMC interacting uncharacterized protein involved in chromosome segregation
MKMSLKDDRSEPVQDIEGLLLGFRELRCVTVSHMALEDAKASLLEIQKVLQDQSLAQSIGILSLVLAVFGTVVVLISADFTVRAAFAVLLFTAGVLISWYLRTQFKTGRDMKRRQINHEVDSAQDAVDEYTALKFTAKDNLLPALDACHAQHGITDDRYRTLKKRLQEAVSSFDDLIGEKEQELKDLEIEIKKLERDPQ